MADEQPTPRPWLAALVALQRQMSAPPPETVGASVSIERTVYAETWELWSDD